MDPLSITASIITVIDAANKIVKYILDVKNASFDSLNLTEELQGLRNELEIFANLSKRAEISYDTESASRLPILQRLANLDDSSSPLACCNRHLKTILEELERMGWGAQGSKRDAGFKALKWPFKQKELTRTRERINDLVKTMSSGLRYDEANLALDTNERVRSVDQQSQTIQEALKHEQVFKWLSAPDTALDHCQASKKRAAATGKWFIDSSRYKNWKVRPHSIYWLHGILGCGKTILASTIIDDLSTTCETSSSTLAYFYCSEKHDCAKILRSLLRQLSNQNRECLKKLEALYLTNDKGLKQPSLDAMSTLLRSMLGICGTTFIVLDALDEYHPRGELMKFIEGIDLWHQDELHFLVTSRNEPDIQLTVESLSSKKFITNIQTSDKNDDLATHIRSRLSHDTNLKRLQKDPEAMQEVQMRLAQKADGMYGSPKYLVHWFRLADCQLDALQGCLTWDMLMTTLESLPATLNDEYTRILGSIRPSYRKLAIKAFQWVIHSKSSIMLHELVDILATDVAAKPCFSPKRRLIQQEDITQLCSNLIDVSTTWGPNWWLIADNPNEKHGKGPVRFAHLSVREFLLSDQILTTSVADFAPKYLNSHANIAQECLNYLLQVNDTHGAEARRLVNKKIELRARFFDPASMYFGVLSSRDWGSVVDDLEAELQAALPLVFYAAEYWSDHARTAGENPEQLFQLMTQAFEPDTFKTWHNYVELGRDRYQRARKNFQAPDRLTYATGKQLPRLVQFLLEQGVDANGQSTTGCTPLHVAAEVGDLELVNMLLKFGADVELLDDEGKSALWYAASGGFDDLVKLFLDKGLDLNQRVVLMAAARGGHLSTARILVDRGANVNATAAGLEITTALGWASEQGHTEMVQLLLSNGISTTLEDNQVSLRAAAMRGHAAIVGHLLDAGFDINAIMPCARGPSLEKGDVWWWTALQYATGFRRLSIVRLLIGRGADVNLQTDGDWRTPLQVACWNGDTGMVKFLLSSGADVNIRGGCFETALMAVCALADNRDHESIIHVLLQHGAHVNEKSSSMGSPLQQAAGRGHIKAIQILLDGGADINQTGGQWGNALNAALGGSRGFAAQKLLEAGADRNVKKELQSRLEDVQRGIDKLDWRNDDVWILNEVGVKENVKLGSLPDGLSRLKDVDFFDRRLSNTTYHE